jgi:hypothetical protein
MTTKSDLVDYISRQREWSRVTFGPGSRTEGIIEHIRKELTEVEASPYDVMEWVDLIILALDGAWRAGYEPEQILDALKRKQGINFIRKWPDWRGNDGRAIEHIRETA